MNVAAQVVQVADISSLAHVIQQAVAPAFVLTATGGFLAVMTSRLARIIDRARAMESQHDVSQDAVHRASLRASLDTLSHRATLVNRAIACVTSCALLICSVIATLFLGAVLSVNGDRLVALAFIAAMALLIAGLVYFLRETFVATRTIRIGREENL
jgi:hypothetical protein